MNDKKKYIVLSGDSFSIETKVNEKIKEGYLPIGGIAVAEKSSVSSRYRQAMILKELENE